MSVEIELKEIKPIEGIEVCDGNLIFNCPHCDKYIIIPLSSLNGNENFIHAIFINNYEQVDPNLTEIECQYLLENNMVFGCCKKFKIIRQNDIYNVFLE